MAGGWARLRSWKSGGERVDPRKMHSRTSSHEADLVIPIVIAIGVNGDPSLPH